MTKAQYRTIAIDRTRLNADARLLPAALSSEEPVDTPFGVEVLSHAREAVDLSRTKRGLALLFNHNKDVIIGRVRDVHVSEGQLRGSLYFSGNARASEVFGDIADGIITDVSIGYHIKEYENTQDGIRATKWKPFEASVVTIGADPTVGINRSKDSTMSKNHAAPAGADTGNAGPAGPDSVDDLTRGAQLERERAQSITAAFSRYAHISGAERLRDECIQQGVTLERAKSELLEFLGGAVQPINGGGAGAASVQAGPDAGEKFRDGAYQALTVRAGIEHHDLRGNEFNGMRLTELARHFLRMKGAPVNQWNTSQMVAKALSRDYAMGHGTSDFTNVLENVSAKRVQVAYDEAPVTWRPWCGVGSLSDFKQTSIVNLSAFSDMDVIYENAEYKQGTITDKKETIQLLTYGKIFALSRQAIINDDVGIFQRVPTAIGQAAARQVDSLAWGVLTTNAALNEDSTALFDAGHNNLVGPGSGAAPSVVTLDAAFTAMALQTDPSTNAVLGIRPRYLLVPVALESTARVLIAAQYDPAGTAGTLPPNPYTGRLEVVSSHYLDTDDPAQWYLAASPAQVGTVLMGFLDGVQTPYLESQEQFSIDGVAWKVRIDAAAAAEDFRGLYQNDGN